MADPNVNTGSAFHAFLNHDPFPTPANDARPNSSASSTNTSDYGTAYTRNSAIPSMTDPVGEPGLPPSRPMSSAISEQGRSTRVSTAGPPSRRGMPQQIKDATRPGSSVGQTHVPSLVAQGFFKPMSLGQLQAQRGQTVNPSSTSAETGQTNVSHRAQDSVEEETDELPERTRTNRYSYASVYTERDGGQSTMDDVPPLPSSRGFSTAASSTDGNGVYSTVGPSSVVSKGSTTPLNSKQQYEPKQQRLNQTRGISSPPPPRSPKSFRTSLGLRNSKQSSFQTDRRPSRSHEKLHSDPSSPRVPVDEKPLPASMPSPTGRARGKNYEYFGGNIIFFLSGRLINTKAKPLNVMTFLLTTLPSALFFAFSAPWLWHNLSPALPIIFAYIFYLAISAFLHAAFSDPGILPRNLNPHPPNPEEERDPLTPGPATTQWTMVKTFPSKRTRRAADAAAENGQAQDAMTAMEVPTKYCKSCSIWRPPRAHHCRVCDTCVETQDHHCVWLNNCVGRRNYRFFFAYVGFGSILALTLLTFSLIHVSFYAQQHNISFGASLSGRTEERIAFAMFIYSLLALPYPGSLFVYHLFLVARGETTREYLNSHKFLPKDRHRPFSQPSFFNNWIAVLCRPRPPSSVAFKRPYIEGDIRLGSLIRKRDLLREGKLEAARSDGRVEGLKKHFSVPLHNDSGGAPGVEMKQLPPLPRLQANGNDLADTDLAGAK